MVRIRRFGIVQTANVVAAIYGVVIVVFFLPIAALIVVVGRDSPFGGAGALLVVAGGLLLAGLYAIVIWIATAIGAALYNVVAGRVGGIEVQLESVAPPPPTVAASWGQASATTERPAGPSAGSPPSAPPDLPDR